MPLLITLMAGLLCMQTQAVGGRVQESEGLRAPRMTTDDVMPPKSARVHMLASDEEGGKSRSDFTAATIPNARGVLYAALNQLASANSLRLRMQLSSGNRMREILIETIKPNRRMRILADDVEVIMIGRDFYVKERSGPWQASSIAPTINSISVDNMDPRVLFRDVLSLRAPSITGRMVAHELIDGFDTVVYQFTVSDRKETGKIEACIAKEDNFVRRLMLHAPWGEATMWFTSINDEINIERPEW